MNLFLLNLLFAVLWMLLWGSFSLYMLLGGFLLGYLLLGLYSRVTNVEGYGAKVWQLIAFVVYFIRILVKANVQIAYEILTPTHHQTPRIIRYDVAKLSEVQITTLANAITLTPGTLVVDISHDARWLYIHCMYARQREQAVKELDELRDRLLAEVF